MPLLDQTEDFFRSALNNIVTGADIKTDSVLIQALTSHSYLSTLSLHVFMRPSHWDMSKCKRVMCALLLYPHKSSV